MKKKLYFGRLKSRKLSKLKEINLRLFVKKQNINNINQNLPSILEIGMGMGENLIFLAKKNKNTNIVGVDPFKNGMANVADFCLKNNFKNVFLFPYVFEKFYIKYKNIQFNKIYILFPDPWPKMKHHKRRIINKWFLKKIIKILKKKGILYFSTDSLNYFENVKMTLKSFDNISLKNVKKIITIKTKYFLKGEKKGNKINSLIFHKN